MIADPGKYVEPFFLRHLFRREGGAHVGGVDRAVPKPSQIHLVVTRCTRHTTQVAVGIQAVLAQDDSCETPGGVVGVVNRQPTAAEVRH